MTAVRGTRLRTECPRRPCRTVPSSRRKSHQRRTHAAQRILAAGTCFMCPGGNPTDRRAFSRISSAAIRDARRALPAYIENQPKSAHLSPRSGVFDFSIFNYVVLTTEFGANSPNSPSRRARQHRNLKFRCFNNVNNFAKRKCTHISGSAASNRGTHPQACRITSDPALVSLSCLHANASTFFLAPSNRTPPNRIPLKPSAPPSPLRAEPPSRHKSHPTP